MNPSNRKYQIIILILAIALIAVGVFAFLKSDRDTGDVFEREDTDDSESVVESKPSQSPEVIKKEEPSYNGYIANQNFPAAILSDEQRINIGDKIGVFTLTSIRDSGPEGFVLGFSGKVTLKGKYLRNSSTGCEYGFVLENGEGGNLVDITKVISNKDNKPKEICIDHSLSNPNEFIKLQGSTGVVTIDAGNYSITNSGLEIENSHHLSVQKIISP
jgi:hypothetical protein